MSLHLKLLDIDHPLTFEESKLRQIEAHALIYLSWPLLIVLGIAWSAEADVLLGLHLRESGNFGLCVFQILAPYVSFFK